MGAAADRRLVRHAAPAWSPALSPLSRSRSGSPGCTRASSGSGLSERARRTRSSWRRATPSTDLGHERISEPGTERRRPRGATRRALGRHHRQPPRDERLRPSRRCRVGRHCALSRSRRALRPQVTRRVAGDFNVSDPGVRGVFAAGRGGHRPRPRAGARAVSLETWPRERPRAEWRRALRSSRRRGHEFDARARRGRASLPVLGAYGVPQRRHVRLTPAACRRADGRAGARPRRGPLGLPYFETIRRCATECQGGDRRARRRRPRRRAHVLDDRGCNDRAGGLRLGPEDEVVTTDHEHFGLLGRACASPALAFARGRARGRRRGARRRRGRKHAARRRVSTSRGRPEPSCRSRSSRDDRDPRARRRRAVGRRDPDVGARRSTSTRSRGRSGSAGRTRRARSSCPPRGCSTVAELLPPPSSPTARSSREGAAGSTPAGGPRRSAGDARRARRSPDWGFDARPRRPSAAASSSPSGSRSSRRPGMRRSSTFRPASSAGGSSRPRRGGRPRPRPPRARAGARLVRLVDERRGPRPARRRVSCCACAAGGRRGGQSGG